MRKALGLLLAVPLLVPALAHGQTAPTPPPVEALQAKKPSLQVTIDRARVDLPGHKLEVKLSRAADKVKIKVIGQSGATLAEVEKKFDGAAAGTPLAMTWTPSKDEPVAKIEVFGYDTEGYWSGVAITPWEVNIAHEEVNFETNSDVIRPSEVPKLEASLTKINEALQKHAELGKITLYIVGHTDTVGSPESNLNLSRRRAKAIAAWFKSRGVKNPIAFEGLGESSPLVKTPDETDEPKNRRVDYILGLEPPRFKSGGEIAWKGI